MVVMEDDWNVIEEWFTPEKDFLYFKDWNDLETILEDVKFNYSKYWPMIESAHKKVQNYSIDKLLNKIKNDKYKFLGK